MPRRVVWRLDETTDQVLRKLENPARPGRWRRDGLVVGQVQSGKTANYIGLICKAADAGYKLIVVLAGIHNSLRSQTQLRVDEGFLGFDTQYQQRYDDERRTSYLGVGAMPGAVRLKVASLTNSAETGDFKRDSRHEHQHPDRGLPGCPGDKEAPQHSQLPAEMDRRGRGPADRPGRQEDRPLTCPCWSSTTKPTTRP